jgi:hypothetical protein
MKFAYILLLPALTTLTGCGGVTPTYGYSVYEQTSPGAALGAFPPLCEKLDSVGRCASWKTKSNTCVNPKGLGAEPPIMPCALITPDK